MKELSLFSGAGGGLLGSLLLGWEPIGYVEFNDYCQRVIAQRIADGILPNAPIFGDIRTFVDSGCAELYRGVAEVVSGGFPCQPFSVAGKRAGSDDPRNMWPATLDTVRAVRPRYCFFENVPGLLASGYFERILCDLAESGYSVRWRCLSAAELGAPHKRDRLWIVAHAASKPGDDREIDGVWCNYGRGAKRQFRGQDFGVLPIGSDWQLYQPAICGADDGVASRVDRLKAIGNGQVPLVAATAWHLLTEDLL